MFWCHAFERYNGILGSMQTNGKSVENQVMRRFCREQELSSLQLPDDANFRCVAKKLTVYSRCFTPIEEVSC